MKYLSCTLLLAMILLSSCAKEQPKTAGQKQEPSAKTEVAKTGPVLLAEAKEKLSEAKEKLKQEGKYSCCLREECSYCALHEGSCPCYNELKAGEHVCIECYAGWQQGIGDVENIRKQDVKTDFVKHEHKH